jgi:hypothetical protein
MSEIIDANFAEVPEGTAESTARSFHLKIEFAEAGVSMHVNTNLSPLEQLGAIELWKTNVLDEITGKKSEQ